MWQASFLVPNMGARSLTPQSLKPRTLIAVSLGSKVASGAPALVTLGESRHLSKHLLLMCKWEQQTWPLTGLFQVGAQDSAAGTKPGLSTCDPPSLSHFSPLGWIVIPYCYFLSLGEN